MNAKWLFQSLLVLSRALVAVPALASGEDDARLANDKQAELTRFTLDRLTPLAVVSETEPNNSCASPDPADIIANQVSAAIGTAGDEDWFAFVGTAGQCVTIATTSMAGSTSDTQLYLYDAAGCGNPANWSVWDDDAGPGLFSLINAFQLPASGTYYALSMDRLFRGWDLAGACGFRDGDEPSEPGAGLDRAGRPPGRGRVPPRVMLAPLSAWGPGHSQLR
jgi:hypothetical protein